MTDVSKPAFSNKQVFKAFLEAPVHDSMYPYRRQIEESTVTQFLAKEFNKRNAGSSLLPITVVSARAVEVHEGGRTRFYNMERLLKVHSSRTCIACAERV